MVKSIDAHDRDVEALREFQHFAHECRLEQRHIAARHVGRIDIGWQRLQARSQALERTARVSFISRDNHVWRQLG